MRKPKPHTPSPISVSNLRSNMYQALDAIIETGIPLVLHRKGHLIRISLATPEGGEKLSRIKKRRCIVGSPETLVHLDWSSEWSGGDDL